MATVVALQLGETWLVAGSHSFKDEALIVKPAAAESLVKTVLV
jgi:hypothetical protein